MSAAVITQAPADRQFVVALATALEIFPTYVQAQARALDLEGPVYVAKIRQTVIAPGIVQLPQGIPGPDAWVVDAVDDATAFLPWAEAIEEAYTTSANAETANSPAIVGRVFQIVTPA